MSNATLRTADQTTHLKIVVLSLIASVGVMLVGITARTQPEDVTTARLQTMSSAVKAGKSVAFTHTNATVIR